VHTNLPLLVQRDDTYSTPVPVDTAESQPGIFLFGQQPAIVDSYGNLIGPSNPAHAGDVLVMYLLGLGAVTPPVADGVAAPSNPPASMIDTVTMTAGTLTLGGYIRLTFMCRRELQQGIRCRLQWRSGDKPAPR
jgi:uncharacterized protein (TIGR03437 family)